VVDGAAVQGGADGTSAALWGCAADESGTVTLSPVIRTADGSVAASAIGERMRTDPAALTGLLPPFAAMRQDGQSVTMVADSMGFRPLYHTAAGPAETAVLSSSALLAGRCVHAEVDLTAIGNQSLLGWQLGLRTLYDGVRKLAPGAVAHLTGDGVRVEAAAAQERPPLTLSEAVDRTANLMRRSLSALLDDHPDAVLQLTGGLDSRLLLSAIPVARRRGLRAMTLEVPGSGDVAIARDISERYGIDHDVRGLASVGELTDEEAWHLCATAARRLDGMSDPVALAALGIGEREFEQGVRISGLGGEVARGFYYVGHVSDRPYGKRDAARLAGWRMFVNDAVEPGLLTDEFSAWSRERAEREVYEALREGGDEWFRATDALYLRHRMQRWAGITDIAVSAQRTVINPMLDAEFLDIATRLRPQDKAGSRYLAALQLALDPELARMPLEGRPAPAVYAHPPAWQPVLQAVSTGRRLTRKAVQRLRRGNRPPAGGTILAAKVVEFWRDRPETVSPVAALPFVSQEWMSGMLERRFEPRPSSVAFLTNLVIASAGDG